MEISEKLLCLFSAEIEDDGDAFVVEVPRREIETGSIDAGDTYRVALIAGEDAESEDAESTRSPEPPSEEPQPPVEVGETRYVEIEDIGKQGDGIARVERGYEIIEA